MNTLHIYPEEPRREAESIVLSAAIEAPSEDRKTLWYSVPADQEANLASNADPFVVGCIYLLMESGHDVQVHGTVSPSLIRSLEDFQAAWASWMPKLTSVTIRADREEEPSLVEQREDAVVAFSGGVDSCFTAFRHARAQGVRFPRNVTAGVMVHGFDIPLDEPETFALAVQRSEMMLSSLGLELIPVATNYPALSDWIHSFGAGVASCLMLFSGRFQAGLIAQGVTYNEACLLHEGSNAITDPLLSSDSFRIVPDGTAFDRASKILAMSDWNEFLQHLRVCWEGPRKDQNCCACEKCIRNILTFRALGLELPPCFPHDVEDELLKTSRMGAGARAELKYGGLASLASARGIQDKGLRIIERRLAAIRRRQRRGVLWHLRKLPYYRAWLWSRLCGRG